MARKVTVTKAEYLAVAEALQMLAGPGTPKGVSSGLRGILAKWEGPLVVEPRAPGLSLPVVERALSGCHKYARWIAGNPSRWLKQLNDAGATEEQVRAVGAWLNAQDWMRGRTTLGTIASKWGEWLSRASTDKPAVTVAARPAGFTE